MMIRCLLVCLLLPVVQTLLAQHQRITPSDLQELERRMTGHFSSQAQARADTNFLHIELRMQRIWKQRTDGFWLYVEQAAASALDKPYRQRIYQVQQTDDTTVASRVFEINRPLAYAGAWKDESKLQALSVDSLVSRQGCAILLHKDAAGNFAGTTPGKECLSSLRGASYATSEALIFADRMETWDRGWNAAGKQVWGSEKGAYIFRKLAY